MRFGELETALAQFMAKSTLAEHLRDLRERGLIRKKFSDALDSNVYEITPNGERFLEISESKGYHRPANLEDFVK